MSDESALLATIHANRAESTARLVYADCLDESDRPLDAARERVLARPACDEMRLAYAEVCESLGDRDRAEFIRVQVEIGRLPPFIRRDADLNPPTDGIPNAHAVALGRRERELFAKHADKALHLDESLWGEPGLTTDNWKLVGWSPCTLHFIVGDDHYDLWQQFRRGFVEVINCRWEEWAQHGDAICDGTPVAKVWLTTMPNLRCAWRAIPPDLSAECEIAGVRVCVDEQELLMEMGNNPRPLARYALNAPDVAKMLMKKRWHGIEFDLPPTVRQ